MNKIREENRNNIIVTAHDLFYKNSYRAVGVEWVANAAGITKKTLYSHFPSKMDLIIATLEYRDEVYLKWLQCQAELCIEKEGLDRIFPKLLEILSIWIDRHGFHGCMFINALAEFEGQSELVEKVVVRHKRRLAAFLERIAREANFEYPAAVSWQVSLVMEGLVSMARFVPLPDALTNAEQLMGAALKNPNQVS